MKEYLFEATLTGVLLLCIWLNLANGYMQALFTKIMAEYRLVSISFALLLLPFLLAGLIGIINNIPERIFSLLAIPVASGTTALFIFLVNLKLEHLKHKRENKSTAKLLIALIESKVSIVEMVQPRFFENKINMFSNFEVLGLAFNAGDFNKVFIEKGGTFSDSLVGWMAFYLSAQQGNRDFLLLAQKVYDDKKKEDGLLVIDFLEKQRKNLDHKLETLMILSHHLLVLLSAEVLQDEKKAREYNDYIKKVRYEKIQEKGVAYSNILDFIDEGFGKASSPFFELLGNS
jgi:hypothetical protein